MPAKKHLVCITFDFDAMSGFIARGMVSPTPISRGEFGVVAVPRILKFLDEYRVPASFFIPAIPWRPIPRNRAWSQTPDARSVTTAGRIARPPP